MPRASTALLLAEIGALMFGRMYQLLFVIHGMGAGERPASNPDWSADLIKSLKGYAKSVGHQADFVTRSPGAGQVLIVPLTYHDYFDKLRASWKGTSPNSMGWIPLLQQMLAGDPSMAAKVPGWAAKAGEFFWTHVLDVLLYRFIPAGFTTPIRDDVALQIEEAWHKADIDNGAPTPVHFLSHSLGTAVLHDAICRMATYPEFGPGTHEINTLITVANVSHVLENGNATYASADRTLNCVPPPTGMTRAYYSFRHELDPIAAVKAFAAEKNGWPATDYFGDVFKDVKDWNVHGYTHYTDHPGVHYRLMHRMWSDDGILAKLPQAVKDYTNTPGTPCPNAIARARQNLMAVTIPPADAPVAEFIETLVEVFAILLVAAKACDLEIPS